MARKNKKKEHKQAKPKVPIYKTTKQLRLTKRIERLLDSVR